jgi:ABC-type nitrate/sulfonate/bicarbonate transport system permease component
MRAERAHLPQATSAAKGDGSRRRRRHMPAPPAWTVRIMAWITLLAAWELYGRTTNPILFTYPTAVAKAFMQFVANGELLKAAAPSLQVLFSGLFFAIVIAIPFGVVMARFRFVDNWFDTYIAYLYATPTVALVPVIVLWAGIGIKAKIIIVTLFSVFPVLMNTVQGVKNVDETLLEVARSFKSSEWRIWVDVVIPSAIPFIVTGLRLAVGRALIGTVLAEMYTSITGLGYMITTYANSFQTARMFVPIVFIGTLGVILTSLLNWAERKFAPWKAGAH